MKARNSATEKARLVKRLMMKKIQATRMSRRRPSMIDHSGNSKTLTMM
jgi:hypothetical protein